MHKSCTNCNSNYVCKFKPVAYMGTCSGGQMYNISYKEFNDKLFGLYGKYCASYQFCSSVTSVSCPTTSQQATFSKEGLDSDNSQK